MHVEGLRFNQSNRNHSVFLKATTTAGTGNRFPPLRHRTYIGRSLGSPAQLVLTGISTHGEARRLRRQGVGRSFRARSTAGLRSPRTAQTGTAGLTHQMRPPARTRVAPRRCRYHAARWTGFSTTNDAARPALRPLVVMAVVSYGKLSLCCVFTGGL